MSKFWRTIENIHGAVPARWQAALVQDYDVVKLAFLRATGKKVGEYPCPHECDCWHEVIEHDDGEIVGICQCDPFNCDDLKLSADAIELFELNTAKLGRAVARAFGCDVKEMDLGLPGTWQIGAFSGASMPVVLTMQSSTSEFRNVVAQLICKLRERFVLLAPTGRYVDAISLGMLAGVKAGFLDLESNLDLASNGVLIARSTGGELFSRFLPEQREALQQSEAEKVIAMVSKLRSERGKQKAPLLDIFNYLVLDGISKIQAAKQSGCTPGLISLRVKELESRFGMPVERLQAFQSIVRERSSSVKGDEFRTRKQGARMETDDLPDHEDSEYEDD